MTQVKVYGLRDPLNRVRPTLSAAIECLVHVLGLPAEKRFQRFIPLEPVDFIYPEDRSERYTIIELCLFAGRSVATRKALIQALNRRIPELTGIPAQDIEITLFEVPRCNWGIRGQRGDEL